MITLPGPEKSYLPKITLQLVGEIEGGHGSLYLVAECLLDKSLPLCEIVEILKILYRASGCEIKEEVLDAFLLTQPCAVLLISALVDILGPVERLGAVTPGETPPARTNGSI